jgi:hypothetical protein
MPLSGKAQQGDDNSKRSWKGAQRRERQDREINRHQKSLIGKSKHSTRDAGGK